ncbi:hypothetical protein [Nocardioides jishulii]|uniref:Uncharacterized protein n=1 Tax=Nocardioides jishulii TaxID=2575440 RepID=A0A4U2YI30_9ACTN|nr:hypothetical protein [Nocardioides jishulii]QCX28083.1 hypothetical protein FCL41_11560 [Nocardioides jishulii]TKI60747.1 hypothetical protein FC770_14635 [Nocardioides jishulii]
MSDHEERRQFIRNLLGRQRSAPETDTTVAPPNEANGNVAAREGHHPNAGPDPAEERRRFLHTLLNLDH